MRASLRSRAFCLLALFLAGEVCAAKKDFKGLFGSYRRERFTENEGNASDWGFDLMLSTAMPLGSLANSTESTSVAATPMAFSTYFNAEGSLFFTLAYNWELFLNMGYYSFETRRQNGETNTDPDVNALAGTPLFHTFEMSAIPVTLGVRHRFGRTDIVPYVGLGVGAAYVHRRGGYDYSALANDKFNTVPTAQATVGVEFFISARAGIRLEASGMMWMLPTGELRQGTAANFPIIEYQANPFAVRYASGLFVLF